MHTRILTHVGDYLGGLVAEVTTGDVDEGELPFDTECWSRRTREIDPNRR